MTGARSTRSIRSVKSRRSAQSRRSRSSYRSGGSSFDGEHEERREHPYDRIFGKKVNTALRKINLVKLTLNEFKQLDFDEPIFPGIIHDLIEYLTGYSIREYARVQKEKERVELIDKKFIDALKEEKLKDPNLKDEAFKERWHLQTRSKEEAVIDEYDIMLGEPLFSKLWRFFSFVAVPPPATYTEWEKHKAYITHDSLEK